MTSSSSSDHQQGLPTFDTQILKVDPAEIKYPPHDATTKLPEIDPKSTTYENIQKAVDILKTTEYPVAFPTETVYGLGASGLGNSQASKNIYKAKNRPADNPLILHISSLDQLTRILKTPLPPIYSKLVDKFWPGPLTIILPNPEGFVISPICTHGQSTFAVRMPQHPVARALIALSNIPLAAPSANASTRPSPTKAEHVYKDLKGRIPLILDGGSCEVGVESTVVDGTVSPPRLLRPGGVSLENIKKYGGKEWENVIVGAPSVPKKVTPTGETVDENFVPRTPGMKYKHYSPSCPVYLYINSGDGLNAVEQTFAKEDGFKSLDLSKVAVLTTKQFNGSSIADYLKSSCKNVSEVILKSLGTTGPEISHNLFDYLREMDEQEHVNLIIVEGIDTDNEGLAVMNRLCKAASKIYRTDESTKDLVADK